MTSDTPSPLVSDADRAAAKDAMNTGWNNCRAINHIGNIGRPCDCDMGATDGCKTRVESIALAIAKARMIAAAPDLLAALEAILHADNAPLVMSDSHSQILIDAARAAVTKATGQNKR